MEALAEVVEDSKSETNEEEEGEEVKMALIHPDHCHSGHTHCDRSQDWKAKQKNLGFW